MPFEYYDVEDDVVTKLVTEFTNSSLNVDVIPMPEDEEQYQRGIEKPLVIVAFVAAKPDKVQSTNQHSYQEDVSIVCNIQSQSLRDDLGCHTIARIIKKALVGFQPNNCGRLAFKSYTGSDPIRNAEHKLWYWDIEFSCSKLYVQENDDEDESGLPLLNTVIINDQVQQDP